ncbi:hypothetical protein CROQUDRAFT_661570 [Cronartium quercuum f. sp. fusiforme G11]|uniref:Uncharacterized protein n=1 Tax=Cronartium quercuum f. sp. fusiforme G11 TaxID=708437 RepID=A0A9P6NBQ0_9BASI|nr:hypothetical protein CROQUDRAFT_661570 [Cronartium quercuum f. sp. fusiforme G11]
MRATQDHHLDELDLEEDLEFFMTGSPEPMAVGALPVTELPDRNLLLRSSVSQTVPPVSDFDSIEPAAGSLMDERPSSAKKQKLASGDDTKFGLEIEDDFDFLDSRPSTDLKTMLAIMKLLGESDR